MDIGESLSYKFRVAEDSASQTAAELRAISRAMESSEVRYLLAQAQSLANEIGNLRYKLEN